MRTDRFERANVGEANIDGRTRSRDLGVEARHRGERPRAERGFRDIHGREFTHHPDFVLVARHDGRNATGDDDIQPLHWAVECGDRGGPG